MRIWAKLMAKDPLTWAPIVRRYRDQLLEGGRTAVTANSAVKVLRVPLRVARKQGILIHNPAEGVELLHRIDK